MEDAEKALSLNNTSTRAKIAKAEALYSLGQFENALVVFQRCWRTRQDGEIKAGIAMCKEVILSTVGNNAMEYDKKVVKKVIREQKQQEMKAQLAASFKTKVNASQSAKQKEQAKRDADRNILGKMQKDLDFLQGFLKFQDSKRHQTNFQCEDQKVKTKTTAALDYLEKRKTFWQQTASKN